MSQSVKISLDAALDRAAGFRAPASASRGKFLRQIAAEVNALGDELIQVCHEETSLDADRLRGERSRTTNQLEMFAELIEEGSWVDARIDTALPERKPVPKPDLRRVLHPLGPVAVFCASNFPLAFSVAGGDTASALAAGCAVVVKPHPGHPRTSSLVGGAVQKAAAETGMPEGVFHLVNDVSVEAGTALVVHPAIKAVGFTGSLQAGRALFNLAAGRPDPIPVFVEMSSLNPLVVMPGALRERQAEIIRGLTGSVTLGVGQFCTKPGVVLGLRGPELERFETGLADAFANVPAARMLHRGIEERLAGSLGKTQDFIRFSGAAHLLVASAEDFKTSEVLREEIFGPATLIIECADQTQLLDIAQTLDGQLTATVYLTADEHETSRPLLEILAQKVGRLIINGYPTGVEVCPSMQHGGPYPATADSRFTSVGTAAIQRFARPVCYQSFPEALLPPELHNANRCRIWRQINGKLSKEDVGQ